MEELFLPLLTYGVLFAVSLITADGRWPSLFVFTKPATTLSLLLVTGLPANDRFGVLVVGAILLSALGDTALLHEGRGFFVTGLLLFLCAHGSYTFAFLSGGGRAPWASSALVGGAIFFAATGWLLYQIWPGIERGLRFPVMVYGLAITVMVSAAYLVLAGPWPDYISVPLAAGAVSFYLSDALLAWTHFRQTLPQQQTLNLGLYWTGQLGIAVATRFVVGGG
ncbi:MAG TPA: lysoplasmalogenase [Polyangia bacterium]